MILTRNEGWERRMDDAIEWARSKPYVLGRHDCFVFASEVVRALTGCEVFKPYRGRYITKADAMRIIEQEGGTFTGFFTRVLGVDPCSPKRARRGDILECRDEVGEKHLGVCLGEQTAVLGEYGLAYRQTLECSLCWRIG
jgi:hypothetical protein